MRMEMAQLLLNCGLRLAVVAAVGDGAADGNGLLPRWSVAGATTICSHHILPRHSRCFLPHTETQILFYARLLGDILGRMVPPAWQLSSSSSVLSAAFLKTKLLVVLVPGILNPNLVGGDLCLAALVAGNWFMSGYINTGAYLLAPRLATHEASGVTGSGSKGRGLSCCWWPWGFRRHAKGPTKGHHSHQRSRQQGGGVGAGGGLDALGPAALRSKAGAVMSFCFQTSCFLGLMAAWVVQEVLQESGHPAFAAAGAAAAASVGGSKLGTTADGGGGLIAGAAAAGVGLAAAPDTTGLLGFGGYDVLGGVADGSGMPATEAAAAVAAGGGGVADAAGGALGAAAAAIAAAAAVASGGQAAS